MATRIVATEADLLAQPKDGYKYELVDGDIKKSPAGARHERVGGRLCSRLEAFAEPRGLGYAFGSSLGVRMPGGNVRSPDVTFVRAQKLPPGELSEDFLDVVPDLVVEVLSPTDRKRDVADKIGEYLEAGVPVVLLVDPRHKSVTVYRSLTTPYVLGADDSLVFEDVLPGFACRVGDIFA